MNEYLFKNGGWFLKIKSIAELLKYHEETNCTWEKAFSSLIKSKEFCKGQYHASDLAYTIGFYGSERKMSPIDATLNFRQNIIHSQIECIEKYGSIYINEVGGYHFETTDEKHDAFIYKNDLVFPGFKKDEIKIKKFPGGKHFYAYIGNMQVKDGDVIKWNTYNEAYNMAMKMI